MTIWERCSGKKYLKKIDEKPWRVVEAQHISSSRDLVDSREEHDILEELLEDSKPPSHKEKHYLIFSPFRYPPLKYGSRFGRTNEPSLWYGSLEMETALTEVAYYRLKFFQDTQADLEYIEIPMTVFQACIHTDRGIHLTEKPFSEYRTQISNKNSYEYSQPLGAAMRESGVEAFLFYSARTSDNGKNIAAFSPDVFYKKKDQYLSAQQNWRCLSNKDLIEFTRVGILDIETLSFSRRDFAEAL
ncbi:RES family NAD+ phosphorylase [Legionella spiritensis]|uniref:RES domain protein n=1 Tax=Legionella spiritensis TaxID=452 RepID=A0A0W0ZAK5_LEGSP|nr:RES family NAD+ phosphorylase [Legionella spiritensis]KTD66155.1 RES domain protein [Legionella spiritensis]SNV43895.1 RES domain [Legionella spiritensis]